MLGILPTIFDDPGMILPINTGMYEHSVRVAADQISVMARRLNVAT